MSLQRADRSSLWKRPFGWSWLVVALWVPLGIYFVYQHSGKALDDFFVTFRYAENLVQGHGFVFNPGERILGLTNPGLGLLLAALHGLSGLSLPGLATLVTGLSLFSMALVLLLEAKRRDRLPEAFFGGSMVLLSGYVWASHSGAASIVLLLLLAGARCIEKHPWLAGLLAGAAVWCRPDAGLGVGLLGLLWWFQSRRLPWRYGIAASAMILGGALAAEIYFGSFVPVTLESKRLLAEMNGGVGHRLNFWPKALPAWHRHGGPLALWLLAVGAVGQIPLFRHSGRAGRLLVLYSIALAVAYPLLGVAFFSWYTVPTAVALLYGFGYACVGAVRLAKKWSTQILPAPKSPTRKPLRYVIAPVLVGLLLLPLVISFAQTSWKSVNGPKWSARLPAYRQAALWIKENSTPDESLAATEIGVLGFYSQRPLEDLLGMVNPKVFPFIPQRDFRGAFLVQPAEFVVALSRKKQRSHLANLARTRWFRRAYEEVARFDQPNRRGFVTVYRRKPGSKLPPPHKVPTKAKPSREPLPKKANPQKTKP
ncbi:MAG: hypothetical protein K0U98_04810 [Deltaproteobacteria bacterium]|nr:hypothetical protein [Deltaproteobacteria bacterium]